MTSLERIRSVVAGQPADQLPVQPMVMMFAARHAGIPFIDYTRDGRKMAEAQLRVAEDFQLDCLLTCSDPAREVIDIAGAGSVEWFTDQGPAINEDRAALLDKTCLRQFQVPDPLGGGRMHDRIKAIEIMRRQASPGMSIVGWVEGPLALAQELRGLNRIMMDLVDDPAFVGDLLDFTAAVACRYADAQIAAGADTIGMSDAAASLIGPDHYRTFLLPRQLRVLRAIKDRHPAILTRLHMCGQTGSLIESMRELPVDIYELDFPVDLPQARTRLGPERVISGNVSTITDLLTGSPADVFQAAARCHQVSGRYHIVNSGCEVSPRTPPENLRALVEYARSHQP
ncbi:MAG: Uroporphyrinogen decarboxylase [Verrucomicrobiae bacterium]|nr:Uroporphyrinogen decarboxylase [Verrucomicrobiae bacterium]